MTLWTIRSAVTGPDHLLEVTWTDGASAVIDFLPIIDRGGWFTPLRDGEVFASSLILLPDGAGVTWPEEIDYSADFLRAVAFPNGLPSESA